MVQTMLDGYSGGGITIQTLMERQQANGIVTDPTEFPGWIERYAGWYADFQRDLFHHPNKATLVTVTPTAKSPESADAFQASMALTMAGQMIFFSFFTGAYSMMSILYEEEEGTLARLFTTPTNRTKILAGKFTAVVITVVIQGLVLMVAGHYAFGVSWGRPLSILMAFSGQILAASGLGVFLISFVQNTRQGGPVLGGGLTALGMLGGLFTANIPGMPAALDTISLLTPQGWVIKIWKLSLAGQGTAALLLPFSVLVILGMLMFAAGAVLFRRRFV
jgi:ABC-2 type transport system permease protein